MQSCHVLFLIFVQLAQSHDFTADNWNSFDAYGSKLVANDVVVVQARNRDGRFYLQFGPFNTSNTSLPCQIDYIGVTTTDSNFIYNINVPHQAYNSYDGDASVVFVGENDGSSISPYPFVGHLQGNSSCGVKYHIHLFVQEEHDEFFVVGVEPSGEVAYGFTSRFAFSYNLITHSVRNLTGWPISTFQPHAVDLSNDSVAVVAGFVRNADNTFKPLVYILQMNISSFSVIDTWAYVPTNDSWQATALNRDAVNFTAKHAMSVAIYSDSSQVLIGMPSMNTVFRFDLMPNFTLVGSRENGYQRGYGQTVGWNDELGGPYAIVLGNTYSFPYEWSSSTIYWFSPDQFFSSDPVMPLFPTIQCPQWIDLGQQFVTIAITTFHVVLLDSLGQVYMLMAAPMGSYPGTGTAIGDNPAFSSWIPCQAGTYKNWLGLDICYPCLIGTMSESEGNIQCVPYDCGGTNSFCPIISTTNDTYSDVITFVTPAVAYPTSPESIVFDDILIGNMFSFNYMTQCLTVSPLFWMALMIGISVFLLLLMGFLKFFHRWTKIRLTLKQIFQQIDLIKEGELWVGGLASFALVILLAFAFSFSKNYVQQYPIETSSPSTFACDTSLRNAKFGTSVESLSIPRSDDGQAIFDMLDEQVFTLVIDFINTKYQCKTVKVTQKIHARSKLVPFDCKYNRSMLTVSVVLDSHTQILYYDFTSVLPIGGLRVSLYGEETNANNATAGIQYLVRQLDYRQPFFLNNHTLTADPNIVLSLTRVINETEPLTNDGDYVYSAVWVPVSLTDSTKLYLTVDQFLYYGLLKPSLSVSISENTYFISNVQSPIAKTSEVIFHNLLFTIVCFELFGLVFLIMKLIGLPLFNIVRRYIEKRFNLIHPHRISVQETIPCSITVKSKSTKNKLDQK